MNKRTKLLDAMRNNPRDWRIEDLLVVANSLDIECRNNGGSHHVFSFPGAESDVTVPAHRPIKPVYIRQFLLLVDSAKECRK
ncbi:MAG: type II toxin-antitoxin system HicA family toxin [Nitrosomonadales bacterium]|nr:type II toxin-antitoxin system HicA family toxin [Nitrosomonadales bacterium]